MLYSADCKTSPDNTCSKPITDCFFKEDLCEDLRIVNPEILQEGIGEQLVRIKSSFRSQLFKTLEMCISNKNGY